MAFKEVDTTPVEWSFTYLSVKLKEGVINLVHREVSTQYTNACIIDKVFVRITLVQKCVREKSKVMNNKLKKR